MTFGRIHFVSDLHLDAAAPDAIARFVHFLQHTARDTDGLYILGDLFETWIGDDDEDPVLNQVCNALREFTATGAPCYIQRGNRDFLLGSGFTQRTGCQLLPDPVLLQWGTVRAVLTHGDTLCTADHRYQQFRSLARHSAVRSLYLRLPRSTRQALANKARAGSREHTRYASANIMDVHPDAVCAALRAGASSLLIHGHTHRPGIHDLQVDGRAAQRIVLGDWYEQGSCLVLHADGRHALQAC
jgi:UDP-2,3-diacylglucosamine hydrolase